MKPLTFRTVALTLVLILTTSAIAQQPRVQERGLPVYESGNTPKNGRLLYGKCYFINCGKPTVASTVAFSTLQSSVRLSANTKTGF